MGFEITKIISSYFQSFQLLMNNSIAPRHIFMLKRIYERNFFDRKPLNSESLHSYAPIDPGKILADIKFFFPLFSVFSNFTCSKDIRSFPKKNQFYSSWGLNSVDSGNFHQNYLHSQCWNIDNNFVGVEIKKCLDKCPNKVFSINRSEIDSNLPQFNHKSHIIKITFDSQMRILRLIWISSSKRQSNWIWKRC